MAPRDAVKAFATYYKPALKIRELRWQGQNLPASALISRGTLESQASSFRSSSIHIPVQPPLDRLHQALAIGVRTINTTPNDRESLFGCACGRVVSMRGLTARGQGVVRGGS